MTFKDPDEAAGRARKNLVDEINAPGALFFGPWLQKVTSSQQILDPPRSDRGVPRNHGALRLEQ